MHIKLVAEFCFKRVLISSEILNLIFMYFSFCFLTNKIYFELVVVSFFQIDIYGNLLISQIKYNADKKKTYITVCL